MNASICILKNGLNQTDKHAIPISVSYLKAIHIFINVSSTLYRSEKQHYQRFLADGLAGKCYSDCDADQPYRRRKGRSCDEFTLFK